MDRQLDVLEQNQTMNLSHHCAAQANTQVMLMDWTTITPSQVDSLKASIYATAYDNCMLLGY